LGGGVIIYINTASPASRKVNAAFALSTQGKRSEVAGRSWQAVPHTGGTETGLKNWRGKTQFKIGDARWLAPSGSPVPVGALLSFQVLCSGRLAARICAPNIPRFWYAAISCT